MDAPYLVRHVTVPEESDSFSDMVSVAHLPFHSGIFSAVLPRCFFHKASPGVCWALRWVRFLVCQTGVVAFCYVGCCLGRFEPRSLHVFGHKFRSLPSSCHCGGWRKDSLQKTHLWWISGLLSSLLRWMWTHSTSNIWTHLTLMGGPDEQEVCRCLGCTCFQPSGAKRRCTIGADIEEHKAACFNELKVQRIKPFVLFVDLSWARRPRGPSERCPDKCSVHQAGLGTSERFKEICCD